MVKCKEKECFVTFGSVKKFNKDVRIKKVSREKIFKKSKKAVKNSKESIRPSEVSRNVRNVLRKIFKSFIYDSSDCGSGCWCNLQGPVIFSSGPIDMELTFNVMEEYRVSIKLNPVKKEPKKILEEFKKGTKLAIDHNTGKPHKFNPKIESVSWDNPNCCTEPTLLIALEIEFQYTVNVTAEVEFVKQLGKCEPLEDSHEGSHVYK